MRHESAEVAKLVERIVRSRWYLPLVVAVWVFTPEVRRIVDWRSSFHALSLLSALPLATLAPGILAVPRLWAELGLGFRRAATVWLLAFGYAFAMALLAHAFLSATFDLALFCLPLGFGVIYGARRENAYAAYARLADAILVCMAISALYGVYQYVSPPPWDAYWAQQANIEGSQGATVAFGFRVFGTLNSTGPFASALMLALVLNLPRLSGRRAWFVGAAFVPLVVALTLTSVRACWIGLLVGTVCYLALAPRRARLALSLVAVALAITGVGLVAASHVKASTQVLASISERISTFSDLQEDASASSRRDQSASALAAALEEPLGLGLGSIGTSLKVNGGTAVGIDNGFLARLTEMGVVGFLLFLVSVIGSLVHAIRSYALARARGDAEGLEVMSLSVSMQVLFLALEAFADSHAAFPGMFYWAMVCASSQYGVAVAAARAAVPRLVRGGAASGRTG